MVREIDHIGRHAVRGDDMIFLNERRSQDLDLEERHVLPDAFEFAL